MRIEFETYIIPGLLNTAKNFGYKLESIEVFVLRFESSGSDLEKIRLIHHRQTMHRQNKPHDA